MDSLTEAAIFRRMSPVERLRLTAQLRVGVLAWKRAALKAQHPEWTEKQIDSRLRELFLYGSP